VLGIVDDYDGDYKPLHAVDIVIFFFHSFNNPNRLLRFYHFKDSPCVFPRYDLQRRKSPLHCACLPLLLRLLLPRL